MPNFSVLFFFFPIWHERADLRVTVSCWTYSNPCHKPLTIFAMLLFKNGPGRFPGIAGNAGNHGDDGNFNKCYQMLNQTKKNIK